MGRASFDFGGETVIVTGAARGIGLEFARTFAAAGAEVVISDDDWDAVLGVSLTGTFRLTRACVPHFRERSHGRVINISSYTGLHGNVGQAAYAAAKAGVVGFTKTAAKELGRFGITVNAIVPNARTRMVESIPAAQREALETQIPLGRFGEPGEMAATAAFLASGEAAYITGTVVAVDGGLSM